MSRWLVSLWWLESTLAGVCALIVAYSLFRWRRELNGNNRFGKWLTLAFFGVGLDAVVTRLPLNPYWRVGSRAVEFFALLPLACYFIFPRLRAKVVHANSTQENQ